MCVFCTYGPSFDIKNSHHVCAAYSMFATLYDSKGQQTHQQVVLLKPQRRDATAAADKNVVLRANRTHDGFFGRSIQFDRHQSPSETLVPAEETVYAKICLVKAGDGGVDFTVGPTPGINLWCT